MSPLIQGCIFLFTLSIFTQIFTPVSAYTRVGNLIQDLQANDTSFSAEAANWTISPPQTTYTTQCEGTFLVGGYHILTTDGSFKRTYYDLPPHNIIYYSIYATFIDQWYYNASFIVHFDNYHAAVGVFLFNTTDDFDRNYCGDPATKDLQGLVMSGKIYHEAEDLTLTVWTINHYDATIRSFGFRDVVLHFRNKTKREAEQNCGNAVSLSSPIPLGQCTCAEGYYLPKGKTLTTDCLVCDPLCKTCLGPDTDQCLKCQSTGAFFNGTHCEACHPSCSTCSGTGEDQCLTCPAGFYLFNGDRCVDTCNFPLTSTTTPVLTCTFPCGATQFVTPTGVCQNTCDYTYNSVTWHGSLFCNDYCTSGLFFVPPTSTVGGSCLVSCPAGTTQDAVAPYCHRCADTLCSTCPINNGAVCTYCLPTAVLDTSGVCLACSSFTMTYLNPITTGHEYKLKLYPASCNLNAAAVQQFLDLTVASRTLLPTASFEVSYSAANTYIVAMSFTDSVLQDLQLYVTLASLSGSITAPAKLVPSSSLTPLGDVGSVAGTLVSSAIGSSLVAGLTLGSTAAVWSIISFQQFVGFFTYINIDFPYQLQVFFDMLSSSLWNIVPNPLQTLTDNLKEDMLGNGSDEDYSPPQKFSLNGTDSFFIDNGGNIIAINLSMHLFLAALIVLKRARKSEHRFLTAVRENLKWNVLARAFLENGIPLFLAICLQLRVLSVSNAYIGISSVMTFIAMIYMIAMFGFLANYLYKISIKDMKEEKHEKLLGTLNEGIQLKENGSKYYHMIIFVRGLVLVILVVFFEDIPFFQVIPCILMNAGIIYYLFQEANFEDRYLGIINKIKESLILLGEMFILGLNFKNASEAHYNAMGWLAVASFCTSLLIETVYMVGLQIKNWREIRDKIVALYKTIRAWFKNMKARQRNARRSRRRYDRAVQNESVMDISAEPRVTQFD